MRVFLDTNVLVSAFVSRGLCTDLLKIVLGEHEVLVSNLVVKELKRVLRDKLRAPESVFEYALGIIDHVEVVPSGTEFDENDDTILAAAIAAEADIFVTGDQELLATAKRSPISAVSPREFMEFLRVDGDSYASPSDGDGESRVSERSPEGVGDKTFEFTLAEPSADYETIFPVVIPKHVVAGSDLANDWNTEMWPAAGPFVFAEWQRGSHIRVITGPQCVADIV